MRVWNPFDLSQCDPDPFAQLVQWLAEGRPLLPEPDAVTVATADRSGRVSARMVLMRHVGEGTVGWYTNYDSRKGEDLDANPQAAVLWWCEPLGRQIRLEGPVQRATAAQSDAYFAARPRGHQIAAVASAQSRPLGSREELAARIDELEAHYEGREIPRPENWGGYRLAPQFVEFWQQRDNRVHDRVIYQREGEGWRLERWSP